MAAAKAASEPAPHPPKDQLPNVSFCITSPPPWRQSLFNLLLFVYCFQYILSEFVLLKFSIK